MPLPCAHSISEGISSSFMFFSATALILTARPAARAASMPASTLSRSPQRVMARNFAGSSVSSETLMRRTPQSAQFVGKARQLRAVGGQRQFIERAAAEMPRQRAHQRHHVAPDQRLAAGQPELAHALGDEGRAQPVEFFQRQQIGLGQEGHVLGHAVEAAQVAAVGDRDAQIADGPAERIGHRAEQRGNRDPFNRYVHSSKPCAELCQASARHGGDSLVTI